tara:strand:- start:2200 stop:2748 length:549 start_codon:yes stop_codon:yes gene_type:complete
MEFTELMNNAIKLFSENTDKSSEELWTLISDKSYEELKKTTRKKNKRSKTGYTVFSSDKSIRDSIKQSSTTELSLGEMSKLVSEKWKSMSSEEQEPYNKLAEEKNKESPVVVVKEVKKKKKTPYNMYLSDKELRATYQESSSEKLSMMEINKLMIAKWKTMGEVEKEKYVKLANTQNELNES